MEVTQKGPVARIGLLERLVQRRLESHVHLGLVFQIITADSIQYLRHPNPHSPVNRGGDQLFEVVG